MIRPDSRIKKKDEGRFFFIILWEKREGLPRGGEKEARVSGSLL